MSVDVMTQNGQQVIPVQQLLDAVLERDASDLHLTAGAAPMLRVHGSLQALEGYPHLDPEQVQQMVYAILTQRQRERLEVTGGRATVALRVPAHPVHHP